MIQTAEGALNETHSILQRMRELATQAANDTNTETDRGEIQKEINQLSSEINRIGNTTEFNTQSLLKGENKANLDKTSISGLSGSLADGAIDTTEATQVFTMEGVDAGTANADISTITGTSLELSLNGENITINFAQDTNLTDGTAKVNSDSVTANSVTVNLDATDADVLSAADFGDAVESALNEVLKKNETLSGNYSVANDGSGKITLSATKEGDFAGDKGYIDALTDTTAITGAGTSSIGTTDSYKAYKSVDFSGMTSSDIEDLVDTGMTINGQQIEFYNADKGAYNGEAIGINISSAINAGSGNDVELANTIAKQLGSELEGVNVIQGDGATNYGETGSTPPATSAIVIEAKVAGDAGENIEITDGGVQEDFTATFQVGANEGQSMTIEIADMRANALGLTGKAGADGFTETNSVTDGTDNKDVEAALDVSTHESAAEAITVINDAIEEVSSQRSELGAYQNRLDHTINNLGTSAENLTAAESRIRDVDYALAAA
ncbi:flagellin N-terminal helical domain-containing protein [Cerasibacillus terrae]|uniref:flagellin N-terminal helical domain-containing protein n=1 Tax=Cerasibacillus terrae TaxID=2498845 RepID=UPI001E3322BE|nr:flagellin [Cerasibacillus terrae]